MHYLRRKLNLSASEKTRLTKPLIDSALNLAVKIEVNDSNAVAWITLTSDHLVKHWSSTQRSFLSISVSIKTLSGQHNVLPDVSDGSRCSSVKLVIHWTIEGNYRRSMLETSSENVGKGVGMRIRRNSSAIALVFSVNPPPLRVCNGLKDTHKPPTVDTARAHWLLRAH